MALTEVIHEIHQWTVGLGWVWQCNSQTGWNPINWQRWFRVTVGLDWLWQSNSASCGDQSAHVGDLATREQGLGSQSEHIRELAHTRKMGGQYVSWAKRWAYLMLWGDAYSVAHSSSTIRDRASLPTLILTVLIRNFRPQNQAILWIKTWWLTLNDTKSRGDSRFKILDCLVIKCAQTEFCVIRFKLLLLSSVQHSRDICMLILGRWYVFYTLFSTWLMHLWCKHTNGIMWVGCRGGR